MGKFSKATIETIIITLISLSLVVGLIYWKYKSDLVKKPAELTTAPVSSYEECMRQPGSTIQDPVDNYPEVCIAKDGVRYVKPGDGLSDIDAGSEESDLILAENEFSTIYNKNAPTFTLSIPEQCNVVNMENWWTKHIQCEFNSQNIRIVPQEGGRGFSDRSRINITSGEMELGGFVWIWTSYQIVNQPESYTVYSLDHPGTGDYYLMGVNYEETTEEAKEFVDGILSTMSFSSVN